MSYDMIDRFLRNNLGDDDYAEYSAALDELCTPQPQAQPAPVQQEPVDFTSLLHEAEAIVRGKPVWKRFIDGTPLSNDIAVWMAVFAQDVARRITKGN